MYYIILVSVADALIYYTHLENRMKCLILDLLSIPVAKLDQNAPGVMR